MMHTNRRTAAGIAIVLILSAMAWAAFPHEVWIHLILPAALALLMAIIAWTLGAKRASQAMLDTAAADDARRAAEEKYRLVVERSLAGIFVYRDERILYANARFEQMLGYRPEEAIGHRFWDFLEEEDQPNVREQLAGRTRGQRDLRYECRLLTKQGRAVWADVVSSLIEYEGGPAVLVSVYDITDRKEIDEKRRELSSLARKQEEQLVHSTRLAEMGEMAAGIAHELNQPLTGIKNYAKNAVYMLEQDAGNLDEVRHNLHLIANQVDRASKIIGQMRELARRSERQLVWVDVNSELRETVEFVMPQLHLSGVEVVMSLAGNLPPVMGDRIRIEQVFLNLRTNARQAMEEMEIRRLTVRTRHEPGARWPVVIEITDTGKGFPPDVADKLFTPFFSTKKSRQGTGLGLSISLNIIKEHHGVIEAVGEEGKGATFTVRLPIGQELAAEEGLRES